MRVRGVALAGVVLCALQGTATAAPCDTTGPDLIVDGITCQLSGVVYFTSVQVINGGIIEVNPHDGNMSDLVSTGNLDLRADSILVDATSEITALGTGYQTPLCSNGIGPTATAGGIGGCAVRDSGGGGSHFGQGGRGTKDCPGAGCTFPQHWEEDCGNSLNGMGTACTSTSNCRDNDGLPPTNGSPYFHSIYEPEFGASGGDKGCRDGDGFGLNTSGPGGGRVVLAALTGTGTGTLVVNGTVTTEGGRGCGFENDSAGGGAGGTLLLVGDDVTVGPGAIISAAGGLGGDTQGSIDPTGQCGYAQQGNTCDDCGGGGGGGIISVLSVTYSISDEAVFNVDGALGGTCPICQGEAGGGAGELQIAGGFVGEFCDDLDNDFDDAIDEGIPDLNCTAGPMPACVNGIPQECPADVPACIGPVTDTRARFVVVVDTSGSMLTDLNGIPTFGDGSVGHLGLDMNSDGTDGNDSRLFLAKEALTTVISAYPEIDFSLARYHQDQAVDRACQLAHWFECAGICCTYDDPTNNSVPSPSPACTVNGGILGNINVDMNSPGDECINYAGNCGPPERGADILAGFGADINEYLMWLDHDETNFIDDQTQGAFCDFASGGDCELRGTGPTPLAGSLEAVEAYLDPIIACDDAEAGGCRTYGVILLTDGAESCQGNPTIAAGDLLTNLGVETFVVGFSVLGSEAAQLDAIANAGSMTGARDAFLVGDEDELANALASIVSGSIVFETCNGDDDDCDGEVDEGFPTGQACDDGEVGVCLGTGITVCNATGDGVECMITDAGQSPSMEVCNGADDNCNGLIDENLSCTPMCTPTGVDLCDGIDNDCDGATDEDDPLIGTQCGMTDVGICEFGTNVCIAGNMVCVGDVGPATELCNGIDDDCDGTGDNMAMCPADTSCIEGGCRVPCMGDEFDCPPGFNCVDSGDGRFCVPSPCINCLPNESCINDECVDLCADVTCGANEECRFGNCFDCHSLGCPMGQVCSASECIDDPCTGVDCSTESMCDGDASCSCLDGMCVLDCDDAECPLGQVCNASGQCETDPCADVECPQQGDICMDGECIDDPCGPVACDPGDVCVLGECIDDPCALVDCSAGRTCTVDQNGNAVCTSNDPPTRGEKIYAAGGGCATSSGGGGPGLIAVLGLLLAIVARRRR
jgi:uncharacterized protein (TIGR03382 family)